MKPSSAIAATMLLLSPVAAIAEDAQLPPGKTVADREQPDFAPVGARVGSFLVYPEAKLSVTSDDNLFYEETNPSDDIVTSFAPSVRVISDWSVHNLEFMAGAEARRHADFSAEDMDNYFFNAKGVVEASHDLKLTGLLAYTRDHEGRGSPDAVVSAKPTETDALETELGFEYRPSRFFIEALYSRSDLEYGNVGTSTGGIINNADRNRTEDAFAVKVGYEIQPEYDAFLRYSRDERDYDDAVDDNGFNRDSSGARVEAGVELDLSGVVTGEVTLGAMSRDYDDARFQDSDGWSTSTTILWQVTPLSTVVLTAARDIGETTNASSSGYVTTGYGVTVYHELKRNLLLQAALSFTNNKYEGITREDDMVDFSFSGTYEFNRNVFMEAGYVHAERDSDVVDSSYDRNAISLAVGLRF